MFVRERGLYLLFRICVNDGLLSDFFDEIFAQSGKLGELSSCWKELKLET